MVHTTCNVSLNDCETESYCALWRHTHNKKVWPFSFQTPFFNKALFLHGQSLPVFFILDYIPLVEYVTWLIARKKKPFKKKRDVLYQKAFYFISIKIKNILYCILKTSHYPKWPMFGQKFGDGKYFFLISSQSRISPF